MELFTGVMEGLNSLIWHDYVLYTVLFFGVVFTVWSVSGQYRALTHGTAVTLGRYDNPNDPGAINHFQALSTALSATVGLGNIGGVAIAMSLGGPGALFWMWVVGLLGMSVKIIEVTLAMIHRNLDDPDNPHGGPMWVAKKGFAAMSPKLAGFGKVMGGVFCVALIISSITGGNMFQSWNVADVTNAFFGVPQWIVGVILAVLTGSVLLGGIKRIGHVTGTLVPFMCATYIIAGLYVIVLNIGAIPEIFALIFKSAFSATEATGAFVGGSAGAAFLWGMKRALFSSEVAQGSSAIAHSAAKTDEPVREGVVAGLEPFIDTIVVCTITALVILTSGVWNKGPDVHSAFLPEISVGETAGTWNLSSIAVPDKDDGSEWREDGTVFMVVTVEVDGKKSLKRVNATNVFRDNGAYAEFSAVTSDSEPVFRDGGLYESYAGASLTALAFNQTHDWLGKWLVTIAAWLFAISTIISWGYYGAQGVVYLFGQGAVRPFYLIYCVLTGVTTLGFIKTDVELDLVTTTGTGLLLIVSFPITIFLSRQAIAAYKEYMARLSSGNMKAEHEHIHLADVVSGKDVE